MPPMPGRRGKGRLSLYPADEEGKEDLQGYTSGAGELPIVQEGLGEGVTGCAPLNTAPRIKRRAREVGQRIRRG